MPVGFTASIRATVPWPVHPDREAFRPGGQSRHQGQGVQVQLGTRSLPVVAVDPAVPTALAQPGLCCLGW